MVPKIISFDIGGTDLKMGRIDVSGSLLDTKIVPIQESNGIQIQTEMLRYLNEQQTPFEGVAVSAPGFIHSKTGYIEMGGAIRAFDHFNMKEWIEEKTGLPAWVENDANCVLLAEKWLGKGQDFDNFLVLTVGTGIGGGIFINGKLLHGAHQAAGEFGYMFVKKIGDVHPAYSTMNANATTAVLCARFAQTKGLSYDAVRGETVFSAYDHGDEDALTLVNEFYEGLAMGIYNLVYLFDPEKILIGGGVTNRSTFIEELQAHLSRLSLNPLIVDRVYFKNNAGMIGAAYHFFKEQGLLL